MKKPINSIVLSDTLTMSECSDGFWLYDKTRGMNLSMRAKSQSDAFIEALTYYQNRLKDVEKCYNDLQARVDSFVSQFIEKDR